MGKRVPVWGTCLLLGLVALLLSGLVLYDTFFAVVRFPVVRLPAGPISLEITPAAGKINVRIGNETARPIRYQHDGSGRLGPAALRLERARLGGWWHPVPGAAFFMALWADGPPLAAGAVRDHVVVGYDDPPLPRGRYRGCFQYWQGRRQQEQCSAPFLLPPPEE